MCKVRLFSIRDKNLGTQDENMNLLDLMAVSDFTILEVEKIIVMDKFDILTFDNITITRTF